MCLTPPLFRDLVIFVVKAQDHKYRENKKNLKFMCIFNKPSVAGDVLQTHYGLIN